MTTGTTTHAFADPTKSIHNAPAPPWGGTFYSPYLTSVHPFHVREGANFSKLFFGW